MQSIESSLLKEHKDLLHAFSTRLGGFSQKPFLGNNLAFHVHDKPETVNKNHLFLSKHLNYPLQSLIRMDQVHGDTIITIGKDFDVTQIPKCDALITDLKNIPLMVMVADCIPALIYDPVKKVIAAVHAGRAGIFSKILPKSIEKMQAYYQCQMKDILVVLGPSIHQCCYEVGPEIKEEVHNLEYGFAIRKDDKKYYLDLIAIAHKQLEQIDIPKVNIENSTYCTACNTQKFYSYRSENNTCGRFAGIIMLK